jgi:hypothetical protein
MSVIFAGLYAKPIFRYRLAITRSYSESALITARRTLLIMLTAGVICYLFGYDLGSGLAGAILRALGQPPEGFFMILGGWGRLARALAVPSVH